MNKSPDNKKTGRKKVQRSATDKEKTKILKQEGSGMGGVQIGTQSDEKPLKERTTPRKVRDLG